MYLLTQAIRSRLRKKSLYSQWQHECPKVLVKLSTGNASLHACGPWTWWVLGASEAEDDNWLFAGVMESHAGVEAGLFSMQEILKLSERVWPHARRIIEDKFLSSTLIPVWRSLDPGKPVRLMEFTFGEIANADEETIREFYEREPDWFDLLSIASE